jgi:urease accessory protein
VSCSVTAIAGRADEPRFADRRVVGVAVAWDEATRRRLRRRAQDGTDVLIELDRGEFLADGAVLHDDGERILVVERTREPALVVRFSPATEPARLVELALRLGHAFGNQHIPIDVVGSEARIPITTSESVARATIAALAGDEIEVEVAAVALAAHAPIGGHRHDHGAGAHHHDHP